jgi:serine/threonine protein kinase
MLDGVNILHKNRIFHSDLHDQNIYVHKTRAGLEVKLIDFGLARYFDDKLGEAKDNDFRFLGIIAPQPKQNDITFYVAKRMLDMGNVISSDAAV